MLQPDLYCAFVTRLEQLSLAYMITGSTAGIVYGEPRMTHDVDIVLDAREQDAERIEAAFPLTEFYCPPADVLATELKRMSRGHFNLIQHATGFKADIYIARSALHRWAMPKRVRMTLPSCDVWMAPPEYVIVQKLAFYKEGGSQKHLRDIRSMLAVSPDSIHMAEIEALVIQERLQQQWDEARSQAFDSAR